VSNLFEIPAFSQDGDVHVIVETVRGSRAKFKYDPDTKAFLFSRSLRLGLAYPYDWGFIPSTMAEDGDPLDGLVLNEFTTFPGALIRCRPIGVLEVRQREKGREFRNDRVLFIPSAFAAEHGGDDALLTSELKSQLEDFFAAAVVGTGKEVHFLGWRKSEAAMASVKRSAGEFSRLRVE
jgi:inorganic pyrophosphatase